jgi:membrane associated rhomboid family serine protease
MGIYDRDYYRREGPSYLGSFTERGRMCKLIILINVVCFVAQILTTPLKGQSWFTEALWLNTDDVLHGQVWRLLTYAFLHDTHSLMHIVFNMLFLWWFGSDVEDLYGPREFLAVYLLAAVIGGLAFVIHAQTDAIRSLLPPELQGARSVVGASGAVTAILVLCALHFPTRVIYLFFMIPVPLWLFVIIEVAQDVNGLLVHESHVAVAAHLGGAAFGFVYYKCHWRLMSVWSSFQAWVRQLFQPRLRVYREEPPEPFAVQSPPATSDVDEHLEAKLDAVLEKVARFGRGSLTDSEQQILLRASEVYKRRRT